MPLNPETGMWEYQTRNTPGPGGSAMLGGALDIMNVFTAQRNRRRIEAERLAKLMESLQARPGSDVYSLAGLPEAQTAYPDQGLSVESMRQMAESDPTYQFQQQMAALPQDATPEQMTGVAARYGTPAGVLSSMGATQRAQARASDGNVEARLDREPFEFRDYLRKQEAAYPSALNQPASKDSK